MVGSLLEVGLKLRVREAVGALHHLWFVGLSLLWAFVLCPALVLVLVRVLPLAEPYALGLTFLGMAPCAPFFPAIAEKSGGALPDIAAFTLMVAIVTVAFMPVATPLLARGFTADTWTIAKPLVLYIVGPLLAGLLIRHLYQRFAEAAHPVVRKLTMINTIGMIALTLGIYGDEFVTAVGSYAIAAQLLLYATIAASAYLLSPGLNHSQRRVVALGVCTRNIGAAFAPLISTPGVDRRAIAMVALAVPLTIVCAAVAGHIFARLPGGMQGLSRPATTR